jgi:hypothetical protein
MKFKISKASVLALSLAASSVVLTGCLGGGGGGGGAAAAAGPVIGGVAGKGLLNKAQVKAYCGKKADGDLLGTDTTGDGTGGKANGAYSFTASKPCNKPIHIVVVADANTTMEDETRGTKAAPVGLTLEAVAPTPTGATVTQPVHPFTHMAAAVALAAPTLTDSALGAANSAVTVKVLQPLGLTSDTLTTPPPPVTLSAATASEEQKKLLAALSNISAKADGSDAKTVVDTLATQAAATLKVAADGTYTTAAGESPLKIIDEGKTALAAIKQEPGFVSKITDSTVAAVATPAISEEAKTVVANTTPVVVSSGVDAARKMFVALRDDVQGLANDSKTGFVDVKAKAMTDDMDSIVGTGVDLHKIIDLVSEAERLASAYSDAGSPVTETNHATFGTYATETVSVGSPAVETVRGYYFSNYYGDNGQYRSCKVYIKGLGYNGTTDLKGSTHCLARTQQTVTQNLDQQGTGTQQISGKNLNIWLQNTGGSYAGGKTYNYQNFVTTFNTTYTLTNGVQSGTTSTNDAATATRHIGTFTASYLAKSGGGYTRSGITLGANSKLVPFVVGATDTAAALTASGNATSVSLTGSLVSGPLSMSLASGTGFTYDATAKKTSAKLVGQVKTSAFQYDGTMDMVVPDGVLVNGIVTQPKVSSASFAGKMSTLTNGVAAEFLSGTFSASKGSTSDTVSVSGKVTNGTKLSQLTVSGTDTFATKLFTSSITYGFGTYTLTFSGTKDTATGVVTAATITSSDGTKLEKSGTAILIKDSAGKKIGEVNGGTVNFTDGTYFLLTGATANVVAVAATAAP